ncbi:hypothetical protein J2Z60_000780 [Lactobacillus colini]|uniref:Uncharacterized protein n=1 Tax=Lactobacillus colini TaxID=1819254 RepID=A0ABS4MD44_9LACO|nr:hypothetical protein [Lactobacillus colini]MBP2057609.1 hypothetical protein [Lactobacillus colini]
MDYEQVLDDLVNKKIKEYKVEAKDAFEFQKKLRQYGKRQDITGIAQRGGSIIYKRVNGEK